jgi:hypothetical protein
MIRDRQPPVFNQLLNYLDRMDPLDTTGLSSALDQAVQAINAVIPDLLTLQDLSRSMEVDALGMTLDHQSMRDRLWALRSLLDPADDATAREMYARYSERYDRRREPSRIHGLLPAAIASLAEEPKLIYRAWYDRHVRPNPASDESPLARIEAICEQLVAAGRHAESIALVAGWRGLQTTSEIAAYLQMAEQLLPPSAPSATPI